MKIILFTIALFAIGIIVFMYQPAKAEQIFQTGDDYTIAPISTGPSWIQYPNGHKYLLKSHETVQTHR